MIHKTGEDLFINKELPKKERVRDLTIRIHEVVFLLTGIEPKYNIYERLLVIQKRSTIIKALKQQ